MKNRSYKINTVKAVIEGFMHPEMELSDTKKE